MRKESTTIQKCNSRLTALGLNSDAAFHRSKLILKIYRDVVWVLSERAEELQETAWIMGEQDIESGLCYLENFAPDIELQSFFVSKVLKAFLSDVSKFAILFATSSNFC